MIGLGLALSLAAAYGVFLIFTAVVFGWEGLGVSPGVAGYHPRRNRPREYLNQAGLTEVGLPQLTAVVAVLFAIGAIGGYAVFGGAPATLLTGAFTAAFPIASARARTQRRLAEAREAWPRMIEEIR
ncbi:MAG: hypothetical protein GEU81_18045, partial [Nitriliruptorales bacterium]|nr:hypothetical protein [Nitriliruptorales bacterium]